LNQAEVFGKKISETLRALSSTDGISDLTVPGNTPYREREAALAADFIAVGDNCVQCGNCAEACPVAAIDSKDSAVRDERRCILCCACIKGCPQNARTMKSGRIKAIANRLHNMCQERKEPAFFF
jgi:ferredoxin